MIIFLFFNTEVFMKSKYLSVLIVLVVLFSGNLLAEDFDPAGTKIEAESTEQFETNKTETDQVQKVEGKECCCVLCEDLIDRKSNDEDEDEDDDSPDFQSKSQTRPFQAQWVLSAGPASPVDSYGPGGGIHLGYFLSKNMYLGMTSVAFGDPEVTRNSDDEDKHYDDDKIYGQEGALIDNSVIDPKHVIELRVIPWNFGLYFSGGIIYNGVESYDISFNKRDRTINGNAYKTGLEAEVTYEATVLPTAGIGYNHLFDNAINLSAGLNIALAYPQTPDVDVKAVNSDTTVTQADLNYWQRRIEKNEKRSTALFTFGVGYSF
jgi:hypothetical protein